MQTKVALRFHRFTPCTTEIVYRLARVPFTIIVVALWIGFIAAAALRPTPADHAERAPATTLMRPIPPSPLSDARVGWMPSSPVWPEGSSKNKKVWHFFIVRSSPSVR